jgi:hypothetical protein
MNQAGTKGTKEPFNESSNNYGHMRAVQWIKRWIRAHVSRSKNEAKTTGTWRTLNVSNIN